MAEYSLGQAKGRIVIEYDGKGVKIASEGLEQLDKKAKKTSEGFDAAATRIATGGGILAAGIGLAAKKAIDFEKQISAIGAVSGATQADLDALRKKALQLGADTAFSASEAASAMEELAKAGVPIQGILQGAADATVALAAAGGVALPQAAELAADAMNSFSLSARDLPKIADLIAGAANSSSISVGDFGQSLKQVGAVANLAQISFEDTATAIALMGQAGIKGSDAGTSLKTFLSNLIPVTDKQVTLFKQLGLVTKEGSNAFFDAAGNAKKLGDISQILQVATKDMTSEQKQLTLETIFGSDAIRAAAVLTKSGAAGFETMAAAMGKVTAQEVAAKRLDNTAGALEQLKGSAETAAISFGTLLLPTLTKLFKALGDFADFLNGLDSDTKNLIVQIVSLSTALLLLLGAAVKVYQFAKAVQVLVLAIKAWTIWARIAQAATAAWTVVQTALSIAVNSTFIIVIAIIAALALLAAGIIYLYKHNETFRKIVDAVWAAVKKAIKATVDWIVHTAVPFLQKAGKAIGNFLVEAWKKIKPVIDFIVKGFKNMVANITAVIKFLAPIFKAAFGLIVSVVKTAWTIISAIFSVFRTVAMAIFVPVLKFLVAVFKRTWENISANVQLAWKVITTVWNAIVAFLTHIWNWIVDTVTIAWNAFSKVITAVFEFLRPYIEATVNAIAFLLTKAWNFIVETAKKVWGALVAFFKLLWGGITGTFDDAKAKIIAAIDGIKVIVDKIREFFGQLKAAADKGVGPLLDFIKQIPGKVLDGLGNFASLLFNKGKDLVQGLIDGIKSMFGKLKDTASDLIKNVSKFLPGSPAEEGPLSGSGYVLKRGERFAEDFARGIASTATKAKEATYGMVYELAGQLPVDNGALVGAAQTAAASNYTTNNGGNTTRTVSIQNVNITGVWDMEKPDVPRKIVAKLHEQLDRYGKEYR